MKKQIMLGLLVMLLIAATLFSACRNTTIQPSTQTASQNTSPTPKPTISSTTQSNWWDKFGTPQYGGTLVTRTTSLSMMTFDNMFIMGPSTQYWWEFLYAFDWTLDRQTWAYNASFTPVEYYKGILAESWEQTDPTTITVKLRQGVHWQNKAPVNGRELVADDVVYTYDRLLGTGNGFTQPSPMFAQMHSNLERVVATDKYTVQFKYKTANAFQLYQGPYSETAITAPEWGKLAGSATTSSSSTGGPPAGGSTGGGASASGAPGGGPPGGGPPGGAANSGPLSDWHNAVGTGPFILTEYVDGSSITYSRNPDYWGYDERHPKNKIPYVDTSKIIVIADASSALAALRTGKIDLFGMTSPSVQEVQSLAKTNPEIIQQIGPDGGYALEMRCDTKPFDNINVRKALQLSVDTNAIAKTIYGGLVPGTPCGLISPAYNGWVTPYDQWPDELKQEYSLNTDKAKQLLADAGYASGFKTDCVASSEDNIELLQIIKANFAEINVDMTITVLDPAVYRNFTDAGKQDQITYFRNGAGMTMEPSVALLFRTKGGPGNYTYNNDSNYDALVNQFNSALTIDEAKQLCKKADQYTLIQHWSVNVCPAPNPFVWQPWVKEYSGETLVTWSGEYWARMWVDQEKKKSLGR